MVLWLRRKKNVTFKTTTQVMVLAQLSGMRKFGLAAMAWGKRFGSSDAFYWLLKFLVVALVSANCYVAVKWLDRLYPKPPLGILRGELLKDFDRYSPDDSHTEAVLAEVLAAEVTPSVPCTTSSCNWFSNLPRRDTPSAVRPSACQDFYGHACWGLEGLSLYKQAAQQLMELVADYALSQVESKHFDESRVNEDLVMLLKCVEGDTHAAEYAIDCSFSTRRMNNSEACPARYPNLPHKLADSLLEGAAVNTVEDLFSEMEKFSDKFNVTVFLESGSSNQRQVMQPERVDSFCSWLGQSARCHLMQLFDAGDAEIRRYQKLWNNFYFAPLFVGQNSSGLWNLLQAGKTARKVACAEIHEGIFRQESAEVASAVMNAKLTDVYELTVDMFHTAQEALGLRVPHWLSRHEEGESPRLQQKRRAGYLQELEAVGVELVALRGVTVTDYTTSVYSWEPFYDIDRNVLVVPHGLMALMATTSEAIEPIPSVLVTAQLMWLLLPDPYSPYSWKDAHDEHLSYVTGCFRLAHNATLDFDAQPWLLTDLTKESALLGPLYDVYRMEVIEGLNPAVYLNRRYSNWQLFFVVWAMSYCGDPSRADMVNAVARNSVRFARIFECGMADAMFARRKCNFWVYW